MAMYGETINNRCNSVTIKTFVSKAVLADLIKTDKKTIEKICMTKFTSKCTDNKSIKIH
jgi:hypothetical protein